MSLSNLIDDILTPYNSYTTLLGFLQPLTTYTCFLTPYSIVIIAIIGLLFLRVHISTRSLILSLKKKK